MKFGIPAESLNHIIKLLSSYTEIEKAVVFGSRAMNNFKHGSDVDIALFGAKVTPKVVLSVSAALNEKLPLPYYFDIVNYSSLKEATLIEHIDACGKFLYANTPIDQP